MPNDNILLWTALQKKYSDVLAVQQSKEAEESQKVMVLNYIKYATERILSVSTNNQIFMLNSDGRHIRTISPDTNEKCKCVAMGKTNVASASLQYGQDRKAKIQTWRLRGVVLHLQACSW